jgi:hypothetical protein
LKILMLQIMVLTLFQERRYLAPNEHFEKKMLF